MKVAERIEEEGNASLGEREAKRRGRIVHVRCYAEGKRFVVEMTLSGRRDTDFSVCVRLDNKEKVHYGRFDESGTAKAALSFSAARQGLWQIGAPVLHELELLLFHSSGSMEERRTLSCGFSDVTVKRTEKGDVPCQHGRPLLLLGMLCPFGVKQPLAAIKEAGISLVVCPPAFVNEALLRACDALGIGVSVLVEENDFVSLLSAAEKAAAQRECHPSLLSLCFLLHRQMYRERRHIAAGLRALLAHLSSPLGFYLLEEEKDAPFYTDMPFRLHAGMAERMNDEQRRDLYHALFTEFYASPSASFLLLPSLGEEDGLLSFLRERNGVGFCRASFVTAGEDMPSFPLWSSLPLVHAKARCTLEHEGKIVASADCILNGDMLTPFFRFPKVTEPRVYRIRLFLSLGDKTGKAETAVLVLPCPADSLFVDRAGTYRMADTEITVRALPGFCLLTGDAQLLFSCKAPFSHYTLSARGLRPLLTNENGETVMGLWENGDDTCLFSALPFLALDEKASDTCP